MTTRQAMQKSVKKITLDWLLAGTVAGRQIDKYMK
jgi:hypothetical protein